MSFKGNRSSVYSLAVKPANKVLASGGYDGSVQMFHLLSREPIMSFSAHAEPVVSVDFPSSSAGSSSSGEEFLTASQDSLVRLWDARLEAACTRTIICSEEQQVPL